jgi:hypothetical protein
MNGAYLTRLDEQGWALVPSQISDESIDALRYSIFEKSTAGKRCLLDHPAVADKARDLLHQLAADALISESSVAIQAIAFEDPWLSRARRPATGRCSAAAPSRQTSAERAKLFREHGRSRCGAGSRVALNRNAHTREILASKNARRTGRRGPAESR